MDSRLIRWHGRCSPGQSESDFGRDCSEDRQSASLGPARPGWRFRGSVARVRRFRRGWLSLGFPPGDRRSRHAHRPWGSSRGPQYRQERRGRCWPGPGRLRWRLRRRPPPGVLPPGTHRRRLLPGASTRIGCAPVPSPHQADLERSESLRVEPYSTSGLSWISVAYAGLPRSHHLTCPESQTLRTIYASFAHRSSCGSGLTSRSRARSTIWDARNCQSGC